MRFLFARPEVIGASATRDVFHIDARDECLLAKATRYAVADFFCYVEGAVEARRYVFGVMTRVRNSERERRPYDTLFFCAMARMRCHARARAQRRGATFELTRHDSLIKNCSRILPRVFLSQQSATLSRSDQYLRHREQTVIPFTASSQVVGGKRASPGLFTTLGLPGPSAKSPNRGQARRYRHGVQPASGHRKPPAMPGRCPVSRHTRTPKTIMLSLHCHCFTTPFIQCPCRFQYRQKVHLPCFTLTGCLPESA